MKNKQAFIKALQTLFFSWGGETPAEVFWGANELLEWYELEFGVKLNIRFDEPCKENNWEHNYEDVIKAIQNI